MSADRVTDPGDSHDPNNPTDPRRTAVRDAVPDRGHLDQKTEIAAFEAWQRLPRIGVELNSAVAESLKRSNKRMLSD